MARKQPKWHARAPEVLASVEQSAEDAIDCLKAISGACIRATSEEDLRDVAKRVRRLAMDVKWLLHEIRIDEHLLRNMERGFDLVDLVNQILNKRRG